MVVGKAGGAGVLVVPAPTGRGELEQVVVAAAEEGRAQCRGQGQFVRGVVDGPEGGEEVADLVGGQGVEARFDAVGDPGIGECGGQGVDRRATADEDGDVAELAGSPGFDG